MKVDTFENNEENIKSLESKGITKSSVSKPNCAKKVIRVNYKRGVYWFSNSISAYLSDCYEVRQNVGTICVM